MWLCACRRLEAWRGRWNVGWKRQRRESDAGQGGGGQRGNQLGTIVHVSHRGTPRIAMGDQGRQANASNVDWL